MASVQELMALMQTVLGDAAEEAGYRSGYVRRPTITALPAPAFVQSLVFGCLGETQPTLDDFVAHSYLLGTPVTPQAFAARFTERAVACLRAVLQAALAQRVQAEPRAIPLLSHFTGVYLADCTVLDVPDSVAQLWPSAAPVERKLPVSLDYRTGGLWLHPPQAAHRNDSATPLQTQILPTGALRVTDLGFYDLAVFREYGQQGVYWLSRLKTNAVVYTDSGTAWTIAAATAATPDASVFDLPVVVGNTQMLPCRLVAVRHVPQDSTERTPTWHTYITNCPPSLLSSAAVQTLYALRWQIELTFKMWKTDRGLSAWRTRHPARVMCEVYARLIALLLTHWATVLTAWADAAVSLPRAARRIRHWTIPLVLAWAGRVPAPGIFTLLSRVLQQSRPIACGQTSLAMHQRLLYPSAPWLAPPVTDTPSTNRPTPRL